MTMHWSIDDGGSEGTRLVLEGSITEASDFSFLDRLDPRSTLQVDLRGIEQINSCGVREWLGFVRALDGRAARFDLVDCSPAFVRQLNMIANFKGRGEVRSFIAPYFCEACNKETEQQVELPEGGERPAVPDTVPCPSCGEDAEFDDLPAIYLAFLE